MGVGKEGDMGVCGKGVMKCVVVVNEKEGG